MVRSSYTTKSKGPQRQTASPRSPAKSNGHREAHAAYFKRTSSRNTDPIRTCFGRLDPHNEVGAVNTARIYQHPTALRRFALDTRALPRGVGRAHAPIIWLFLASHLSRGSRTTVWPSNERIAKCTHLSLRSVERGLAYLRLAGKISCTDGTRPRARRRKHGRIIEMHLVGSGENPAVHFPPPHVMAGIWRSCSRVSERPASLVALAVAEFIIAAAEQRAVVTGPASVRSSMSLAMGLVGSPRGGTFNRRLAALERTGLIRRIGKHWRDGLVVHPPRLADCIGLCLRLPRPRVRFSVPVGNPVTCDDLAAHDAEVAAALGWQRHPPSLCARDG